MPRSSASATPLADSTSTNPHDGPQHGAPGSAGAAPLSALDHQDDARPDDGEETEAARGVGHRGQYFVEGMEHRLLFDRRNAEHGEGTAGVRLKACRPTHHGHRQPRRSNSRLATGLLSGVWAAGSGSGGSGGRSRAR